MRTAKETVEELVAYAMERGVEWTQLVEPVHEIMTEWGSQTNEGGLPTQLTMLWEQWGDVRVREYLDQLAEEGP
jgi:hypothetical protein